MTEPKTVLADAVYERLKARIMDQGYPPRERLNIDALAVDLSVSPTPIREALARLSAERLVTFAAFKGYRVSPLLTTAQVEDLMHVRRLIEVDAARLAARRILIPDLITVERLLQQILDESAGVEVGSWSHGYRQFNQLDRQFHEIIVSAAGNQFLLGAYRSLNVHIELGRFYNVFREMDQAETCVEHDAIFQALRARQPDAAADAVERHLHATEDRIFRLIEKYSHPQGSNGATP
ncbi:GntR family transcriptional regulator [Caldilinea sp.]|uniref:GntR family transcriptional regulator n=1 Tax=Caldilinea sp. TaxID=2293560 RepID=UPI002CD81C4A|nr:GntR family transcriptional regulator [Caldilinea sp.]